jgi:heme exporter protein CcmD
MTQDYTLYIAAAYGLTAIVLLALLFASLRDWARIRREVEKLDA